MIGSLFLLSFVSIWRTNGLCAGGITCHTYFEILPDLKILTSFNSTRTAPNVKKIYYPPFLLVDAGLFSDAAQTGQTKLASGMDGGVSEISYLPPRPQHIFFLSFSSSALCISSKQYTCLRHSERLRVFALTHLHKDSANLNL